MKRGLNAEERSYLITAVVVACAIAARVISKAGIAADTMGLIRSVLYIGLYFVWGISIKKRVLQAQVQRYLTAIVGMMIFWFIVRTMKYFFVADIDAKRQLWYLYYFPMLFIPLLSFFVALSLGKTEKYRLPRRPSYSFRWRTLPWEACRGSSESSVLPAPSPLPDSQNYRRRTL